MFTTRWLLAYRIKLVEVFDPTLAGLWNKGYVETRLSSTLTPLCHRSRVLGGLRVV